MSATALDAINAEQAIQANPNIQQLAGNINELVASAHQVPATISNEQEAGHAADLISMLNRVCKAAENDRKTMTKPLLDVKKDIDARFKTMMEPAEKAIKHIEGSLLPWQKEQRRKAEEAAAAAKKAEEEAALAAAQAAEEAGSEEEAQAILDEAAEAKEKAVKASTIGNMGGSVSTRKTYDLKIESMGAFAAYAPECVEIKSSCRQDLIRQLKEGAEIPGISLVVDEVLTKR